MRSTPDALALVEERLGAIGRDVVRRGDALVAQCPAHDDRTPSLSIAKGDRQPVVFTCHAGCDPARVVESLGLRWADVCEPRPEQTARRIEDVYRYHDDAGTVLFEVVRYSPKSFRQRRPDGRGGHRWDMTGTDRVLYRLPAVLAAVAAGELVYLCEGEKDADRLAAAGVCATTTSGGASNFTVTAANAVATLTGAHVVIVHHQDPPGEQYARTAAAALAPIAGSVTVARPHGRFNDVADHLAAGHTVTEFVPVASTKLADLPLADWLDDAHHNVDAETGEIVDDPDPPTLADRIRDRLVSTEQLAHLPPPQPLIDGWLYRDSLAMMFGPSGVGKSFVAIDLAMAVGSDVGSWHGNTITNGPVLYVIAEGAAGVSKRAEAWQQARGVSADVWWHPAAVNIYDAAWASALAEVVAELRPVLVVVDTLARSIIGADENSSRDMGVAIANLDMIRTAAQCCVLIVHHAGKDTRKGARGASALKAAMDAELEVGGTENRIIVRNTKQKDTAEAAPLHFKLTPVRGTDSVVIEQAGGGLEPAGSITPAALDTLEALRGIDTPSGASSTEWKAATGTTDRTFFRHRSALITGGVVVNIGSDARPRYRPADADTQGANRD